jgi:hypothetical protein
MPHVLIYCSLVALSILRLHYVDKYTHADNPGLDQESILVIQQVYLCWSIISATIPNLKAFVRSFGSGFGIGIDMETLSNYYGSKGSRRNQYELGSVKQNTQASQRSESRQGLRSHNDVEDPIRGLHNRNATTTVRHNNGSIASGSSQDHIIRKDVQWQVQYEAPGQAI